MKRSMIFFIVGMLFIGTSLYAANGDLIVNGNEGIGTTDTTLGGKVSSKLSVVPPAGGTGLAIGYSGTQPSFAINPNSNGSWTMFDYAAGSGTPGISQKSGNVGIGTTTPGYKLDVSGDIRSSGTISANNVIGNVTGNLTGNATNATQWNSHTILVGTQIWGSSLIASGGNSFTTITVTGASVGDAVFVTPLFSPNPLLPITAFVNAPNSVSVGVGNPWPASVFFSGGTIKAVVIH